MTSKRRPYNQYSREFKLEALRQLKTSHRPATELTAELGIRPNLLYKWRDQLTKDVVFNTRGSPKKEDQSELTTLKQENKRLKEDLEILKKAAAYFAKELK